jgi:hypothetical protein
MSCLKTIAGSALLSTACLLTGCASIVNGTNQSVSVNTQNAHGAECSLSNAKGKWYISNTPGSVTVHRSYDALVVECRKNGYHTAVTNVQSTTKAMAFGNILFGGVIGASVDMADGSAYDYPTSIDVMMRRA